MSDGGYTNYITQPDRHSCGPVSIYNLLVWAKMMKNVSRDATQIKSINRKRKNRDNENTLDELSVCVNASHHMVHILYHSILPCSVSVLIRIITFN